MRFEIEGDVHVESGKHRLLWKTPDHEDVDLAYGALGKFRMIWKMGNGDQLSAAIGGHFTKYGPSLTRVRWQSEGCYRFGGVSACLFHTEDGININHELEQSRITDTGIRLGHEIEAGTVWLGIKNMFTTTAP